MHNPPTSLRERKRAETWLTIHQAAAALVREKGLQDATVEEIAATAGVSQRTFFNYFATKEEAILGLVPPSVSDEALAAFRAETEGPAFERVVRFLLSILRSTLHPGVPFAERKALVREHPELRRHAMGYVSQVESLVNDLLSDRAEDGTGFSELASLGLPDSPDTARALLMLAGTMMRFAYSRNPGTALSGSDAEADISEAITIFREVFEATL